MANIKNPTQWRSPSGQGYIVLTGGLPLVTNLGLPIVDNTINHFPIKSNPTYTTPKNSTVWTQVG